MTAAKPLTVLLAQPRGFCAGVERAIATVEQALERFGPPVYVRHEIVHNRRVVERLQALGARFVEEVAEIPAGAPTIFSAHGVPRSVERSAAERGLQIIDATCPLVAKVHKEGRRYAAMGFEIILIGHDGHPEVVGTRGQIPGPVQLVFSVGCVAALQVRDPERLAYVTQTTLSVDDTRDIIAALRTRFPRIRGQDTKDICYATQNRQAAVRRFAGRADLILVAGAGNSSNANRLREIGQSLGLPSYLVEDAGQLRRDWLDGVRTLGLTAGASTPEDLVTDIIDRLRGWRDLRVTPLDGAVETVRFKLPDALAAPVVPASAKPVRAEAG